MKKKSRFVAFMMSVAIALSIIPFTKTLEVEAATSKASEKKWAQAYMKVIQKANYKDGNNGTRLDRDYKYGLIYFDKDSIPELIIGLDGYWVSMYTYDNGKVYTIMDQWAYGAWGNNGYYYYPKKNCLYNGNANYAGVINYEFYGKIKNHKIVSLYSKEIKTEYYVDKNQNGYPDAEEITEEPIYYYGDKKISEKKYLSFGPKGTPKLICPTLSYNKMEKKLVGKGAKVYGKITSPKLADGSYFVLDNGSDYYARISKNKLIIHGNYSNVLGKKSKFGTYSIKLSPNCKIKAVCGDGPDQTLSVSEFNKSVKVCGEFDFTIKNSKIVEVSLPG